MELELIVMIDCYKLNLNCFVIIWSMYNVWKYINIEWVYNLYKWI